MADIIRVIILSIVEGITEFIPVSSTGHLILANEFVALSPQSFSNSFNVIIQLGAIMAVVVIYFKKLNPFDRAKTKLQRDDTIRLWLKVIVGVFPAAVLGFMFDDFIDAKLFNPTVVTAMLLLWGLAIILIEKTSKKAVINSVYMISFKTAFFIGLIQCLAMVPGTSRSAATIIGAMILGCSRASAAEFSFFLAIPTMLGATALKIAKMLMSDTLFTSWQWFLLALGSVFSFLVALVVIKLFLDYVKKHDFKIFGYYRIGLSTLLILYFFIIK